MCSNENMTNQYSVPLNYYVLRRLMLMPQVSVQDMVSFCSTCSYYRRFLRDPQVWKIKFQQRWPKFYEVFGKEISNFFGEFRMAGIIRRRSHRTLKNVCSKQYVHREEPDEGIDDWDILCKIHRRAWFYILDYLRETILEEHKDRQRHIVSYCLSYVNQLHVKKVYDEQFAKLKCSEQLYEIALWCLHQWNNPRYETYFEDFDALLDEVVQTAIDETLQAKPNHRLKSIDPEILKRWKMANTFEGFWNDKETVQIVRHGLGGALRDFLPAFENRQGCTFDIFSRKIVDLFIFEMMVAIVARRLGLECLFSEKPHAVVYIKLAEETYTSLYIWSEEPHFDLENLLSEDQAFVTFHYSPVEIFSALVTTFVITKIKTQGYYGMYWQRSAFELAYLVGDTGQLARFLAQWYRQHNYANVHIETYLGSVLQEDVVDQRRKRYKEQKQPSMFSDIWLGVTLGALVSYWIYQMRTSKYR